MTIITRGIGILHSVQIRGARSRKAKNGPDLGLDLMSKPEDTVKWLMSMTCKWSAFIAHEELPLQLQRECKEYNHSAPTVNQKPMARYFPCLMPGDIETSKPLELSSRFVGDHDNLEYS